MDLLFKIWDSSREIKTFIVLEDNDQLYLRLIAKASEKLQIDGSKLALESDGTIIEDEVVLKLLNKETLILLTKEESWKPIKDQSFSLSTCSTETVVSSPSSSRSRSPPLMLLQSPLHEITDLNRSNNVSVEGAKVSQITWENFEIPWHQLNRSVVEDCKHGNRTQDCTSRVVNVTVDSVRELKKFVSTKAFKILAKKIINKYPKQFQDIDEDGVVIGDGCYSLTSKLIDRNNYLNRPHKRPSNAVQIEVPPGKRKRLLSAKAGCANWQPEIEDQNPETLEEKKNFLNSGMDENFMLTEERKQLLCDTYTMQRLFLNGEHTIREIKQEWPILLLKETIFWHFEKLMCQKITELTTMFIQKEEKIFQLGIQSKFTNVKSIPAEEDEKHLKCLQIIGDFFNEDLKLLIKEVDEAPELEIDPEISAPCIVIIKSNSIIRQKKYFIYVEKEQIEDVKCENLMDAFAVMFSLYYNLNMQYPKNVSHTMEFIQRYILKINPDQGSKSKKKNLTKIISLINKLSKISLKN